MWKTDINGERLLMVRPTLVTRTAKGRQTGRQAEPDAAVHRVTLVAEAFRAVEAVVRGEDDRRRRRVALLAHIARALLRHGATGDPIELDQLLDERVPRKVRRRPRVFLATYWTARLDDR